MTEPIRRHRRVAAPVAFVALVALAAATGPASASRGGPGAVATATAATVNVASMVTAEARGDQSSHASRGTLAVPGLLEVRGAEVVAETAVTAGMSARAEVRLGATTVKASSGRVARLTEQAVAEAEARIRRVLHAACGAGARVEVGVVVHAAVSGAAHAGAGGAFGDINLDSSLEAEVRAGVHLVLDGEDLTAPVCERIDPLVQRIAGEIEARIKKVLAVHLEVAIKALRSECDLGARAGTARTELVVTQRTATAFGLHGELDGDDVIVRPAPNTGVNLGDGMVLVLNEKHRSQRPGRHAEIVVNGAVLRVEGVAVATLASAGCGLRGDVVIDAGTDTNMVTVAPEADAWADVDVDAGAGAHTGSDGASITLTAQARADAGATVNPGTGTSTHLATITAETRLRVAGRF